MNSKKLLEILLFESDDQSNKIFKIILTLVIIIIHIITCFIWFYISKYVICDINDTECKIFYTLFMGISTPVSLLMMIAIFISPLVVCFIYSFKGFIDSLELEFSRAKNEFYANKRLDKYINNDENDSI